ncbi:sigma-70 family RNA polymerase sigma factor [Lichenifustis flavocetrariae]|uniref:Sigma-70 family RNA polymerase sigma factor n=1 Tax=Lichenifustis flavocetrariae TaxID=2949735 RepID=A0AA42CRK7_9HYPH|nr:sigma-70 family RNA polymerase sigma factor [Lichenifustis flavocetrariae]MCW6512575.1 sigma-70 family RNA polymerase sigma factor [Lichenifustis flavocetrariae]
MAAPPRGRSLAQYMPAAVHERRLVEMTADQRAQIAERLDAEWSAHMVAAQAGDRIAYEHLLRGCVPLIRRVVGRQDVRLDRIDDITQEVLLTLHRARHTYDPSRSFSAWLCTIAKRRAIDSLRRRGRQDRHEIYEPIAYESHPEAESGREDLGETANQAVSDALDQLPPGQREAIEALALRQLSLDEASAFTGKSKCALKVNIHRALKILRARFG